MRKAISSGRQQPLRANAAPTLPAAATTTTAATTLALTTYSLLSCASLALAFVSPHHHRTTSTTTTTFASTAPAWCRRFRSINHNRQSWRGSPLFSDNFDSSDTGGDDPNAWSSSNDESYEDQEDWQDVLKSREDGSLWKTFESSDEEEAGTASSSATKTTVDEEDGSEDAWLDALSSIAAEEVEFNLKEADRADKVRQMQEWGFTSDTISSTLGVATDDTLELDDVMSQQMKQFEEESYIEEIDLETVESHTTVDLDEETGDPIRSQMVYVDEHTCIGCTNCAMIAQSTFFMHSEHGRARVFDQWGDDDETIQVAIETCPVDCIHYVPYDELKRLEIDRRDQNINFKARLVNQGEYGGGAGHRVGGPSVFTEAQKISGNMGSRCNNCPSRGCKNCPMYGVGKNPVFERKEKERKARLAKKIMREQMERDQKSVDL